MDSVFAAAATSSGAFPRRPRSPPTGEWKTLQCVTAPKMLTLTSAVREERAPADTSAFVLIKFQVVSVAPDEKPPQVEAAAAARTLHAMGSAAGPAPPPAPQAPKVVPNPHPSSAPGQYRRNVPALAGHARTAPQRNAPANTSKYNGPSSLASPGRASSSGGSDHRDLHHCRFPGCTKTFERRYNLRVHMRRHTGETPYPCKQPGCTQMFKWRSSLAHHMKRYHKIAVSGQLQRNPTGSISPAAVTDVRPSEDVAMTGRTVPYTTVQSPEGSSSGGSSKKESSEDTIRQSMLPPAEKLPPAPKLSPQISRKHLHSQQMHRDVPGPIRAQERPPSPHETSHSTMRRDVHRPVTKVGAQVRVGP